MARAAYLRECSGLSFGPSLRVKPPSRRGQWAQSPPLRFARAGGSRTLDLHREPNRSPSDNLSDLQTKMNQWIANGAQLAWLIDPIDQEVSIYRPGESSELHHHPTSVQGSGVMAGFELVMARIWE